jgi:hypothetical protein
MYPWNFGPDQQVNAYSNWNNAKYQMATLPDKDAQGNYYVTDALGKPITPPPGVTLTGPNNWARYDPSTGQTTSGTPNWYPYIQTLANPNPVTTPGPAYNPNRPMPGPNNNINQILAMLQQSQGQNAPGAPATGGAVPGVSLGGGSSAPSFGGGGLGFTGALAALQGMK